MDLQREQSEILDLVDKMKLQGRTKEGWSKYYGDVVCRIVAHYLSKHLPSNLKVFGPNAYMIGFPTEFDLLVGDVKTVPLKFTNAYAPEQLHCIIEVKMSGIYERKGEFKISIERLRNNFQVVVEKNHNLKCTYIAIEERSPKKDTSFPYVKKTREYLEPFPFFVLRNSPNGEIYKGQWERFIKFIVPQNNIRS